MSRLPAFQRLPAHRPKATRKKFPPLGQPPFSSRQPQLKNCAKLGKNRCQIQFNGLTLPGCFCLSEQTVINF
jgi:hypothetical protein